MTFSLNDFAEAFRKAMVETLVPEIKQLRDDMNARFEKMDQRFEKMEERFEKMDERFEKIESKIGIMSGEIAGMKTAILYQGKILEKILDKIDLSLSVARDKQ